MTRLHFTPVLPAQSPEALLLIEELDNELYSRYPSNSVHTLDLSKIDNQSGVFLLAWQGDELVGCGAVARLDAGIAEIKRVYIRASQRGQGFATQIMAALEQQARQLGSTTLRLETGDRQPESLHLYQKLGYQHIPNFGEYIGDPHSICMEKTLG